MQNFYQVIGQIANKEDGLTGELDYVKRCLTFKEAVKIADKMWSEFENNPNYKYGIIAIEKNLYKKDEYGNWEFENHLNTYFKTTSGNWE